MRASAELEAAHAGTAAASRVTSARMGRRLMYEKRTTSIRRCGKSLAREKSAVGHWFHCVARMAPRFCASAGITSCRPLRVFAEDAVVLDAFDAGGTGAGDGLVVDDFVLQPEIGDAETDHVIDDGGTFSEARKTSTRSMPLAPVSSRPRPARHRGRDSRACREFL